MSSWKYFANDDKTTLMTRTLTIRTSRLAGLSLSSSSSSSSQSSPSSPSSPSSSSSWECSQFRQAVLLIGHFVVYTSEGRSLSLSWYILWLSKLQLIMCQNYNWPFWVWFQGWTRSLKMDMLYLWWSWTLLKINNFEHMGDDDDDDNDNDDDNDYVDSVDNDTLVCAGGWIAGEQGGNWLQPGQWHLVMMLVMMTMITMMMLTMTMMIIWIDQCRVSKISTDTIALVWSRPHNGGALIQGDH